MYKGIERKMQYFRTKHANRMIKGPFKKDTIKKIKKIKRSRRYTFLSYRSKVDHKMAE